MASDVSSSVVGIPPGRVISAFLPLQKGHLAEKYRNNNPQTFILGPSVTQSSISGKMGW